METDKKERKYIPQAISQKVLKEYSNRCAICEDNDPQSHHIDEVPSNNDPLNLLPACPNCHMSNIHNPVKVIPINLQKLFRIYKSKLILDDKFIPIFS
ncbi:MAG: HNH endonuclease [Candidatus Delongbacteria bacterium]|nr:HNH endonuclease [Candidatus Delongbacteria bacterium]